eukprot:RCo045732
MSAAEDWTPLRLYCAESEQSHFSLPLERFCESLVRESSARLSGIRSAQPSQESLVVCVSARGVAAAVAARYPTLSFVVCCTDEAESRKPERRLTSEKWDGAVAEFLRARQQQQSQTQTQLPLSGSSSENLLTLPCHLDLKFDVAVAAVKRVWPPSGACRLAFDGRAGAPQWSKSLFTRLCYDVVQPHSSLLVLRYAQPPSGGLSGASEKPWGAFTSEVSSEYVTSSLVFTIFLPDPSQLCCPAGKVGVGEVHPKVERCFREDHPLALYRSRSSDLRTATHWGQAKLLLSEMDFLSLHAKDNTLVVYAGAAPGLHIPYLAKLFPEVQFELIDPARFDAEEKPGVKIHVVNEKFTDAMAQHYCSLRAEKGFA